MVIQRSAVSTTMPPLPDDPALLQHLLLEAQAEITRLRMLIAVLLRNRFGRRSERLGEEALQQGIEDIEQSLAEQAAKIEAAQPATERTAKPPKRNRGSLPEHLPRVEVVVDIADKTCGCCGAPLHTIGEDRSEMLDYVPALIRVQMIRRPRGACPCEGTRVCAQVIFAIASTSKNRLPDAARVRFGPSRQLENRSRDGMVAWIIRGSAPRQRGGTILERMVARKTVCLRRLGGNRRGEEQAGRFFATTVTTQPAQTYRLTRDHPFEDRAPPLSRRRSPNDPSDHSISAPVLQLPGGTESYSRRVGQAVFGGRCDSEYYLCAYPGLFNALYH